MADLNQAGLEAMKDSIKNVKVYVEQVDITDAKACEEFVANVAKEFGRIDVLCNNAGTGMMGDLLTFPEEVFRKHADLMMYAPIRLMNLCIPHFKENGWGSIVTMASMFGKQPGGLLSYDAIKAADIMISKDYSIIVLHLMSMLILSALVQWRLRFGMKKANWEISWQL